MVTHRRLRRSHQRRVGPGTLAGDAPRAHRRRAPAKSAVHVIEEPLSDYIRYELHAYEPNVEAGEDVRVIPIHRGTWPCARASARLLALRRRAPVGHGLRPSRRLAGRAARRRPGLVKQHRQWRDTALARWFPLTRLHRRPRAGLTTTLGYANPPGPPGAQRAASPATPRQAAPPAHSSPSASAPAGRSPRCPRSRPANSSRARPISRRGPRPQRPTPAELLEPARPRTHRVPKASTPLRRARRRRPPSRRHRRRRTRRHAHRSLRTPGPIVPGILQTPDYARELLQLPASGPRARRAPATKKSTA